MEIKINHKPNDKVYYIYDNAIRVGVIERAYAKVYSDLEIEVEYVIAHPNITIGVGQESVFASKQALIEHIDSLKSL